MANSAYELRRRMTPEARKKLDDAVNQAAGRVYTEVVNHLPVVESVTGEVSGGGMTVSQTYTPGEGMSTGVSGSVAPGVQVGTDGVRYSIGGTEKEAEASVEVCIKLRGTETNKRAPKAAVSAAVVGVGTNGSDLCGSLKTPGLPEGQVSFPSGN